MYNIVQHTLSGLAGWQEHRCYYVHPESGKAQWEHPGKPRRRKIQSRGLDAEGARLNTPVVHARVKQDWTEYLPEPEYDPAYKQPWE